jgi:hypothetical protein
MNELAKELTRCLLYFDVFSYPLLKEELFLYCGMEAGKEILFEEELSHLTEHGMIHEYQGYLMTGTCSGMVRRRIKGNKRAASRIRTAMRYAQLISWFPFVRGVFLSGSISKGYMNKTDDIDYFIVTEPGRLWIARSLLTLFKKIFLLNSHRNFCINYFVDSDHLTVKTRNRFTATEIVFLLPVFGSAYYAGMLKANKWVTRYFPVFRQNGNICRDSSPKAKRWLEALVNNLCGNRLEKALFVRSSAYITHKFRGLDKSMFDKCFTLETYELRYLPRCQQSRIMNRYTAKKRIFERHFDVCLNSVEISEGLRD